MNEFESIPWRRQPQGNHGIGGLIESFIPSATLNFFHGFAGSNGKKVFRYLPLPYMEKSESHPHPVGNLHLFVFCHRHVELGSERLRLFMLV